MKKPLSMGIAIAALIITAPAARPLAHHAAPDIARFGGMPLTFERNEGQHTGSARFVARGHRYTVEALDGAATLSWRRHDASSRVTMRFGNRSGISPSPEVPLRGRANYLIGRDSRHWRTGVPLFERVRYSRVADGVDVVLYGHGQDLEYDVVVSPGSDPRAAALTIEGAESVDLAGDGALLVAARGQEIRFSKPVAYQQQGAKRTHVEAAYRIEGRRITFDVGPYDRTRELVIDPVVVFSTYFGGATNDPLYDLAVDASGATFVAGGTDSTNFPVSRALQPAKRGISDAFVAKFDRNGTLLYSTYIGGDDYEYAVGVDVDPSGAAYIVGSTNGGGLPTTTGALQPSFGGEDDTFIAKLTPSGDRLAYLTYLGGIGRDTPRDVAVDVNGMATVIGATESSNFPTSAGALDRDARAGRRAGFAAKLNQQGSALVYSTLLTGNEQIPSSVVLDTAGRAVIAGQVDGSMTVTQSAGAAQQGVDAFVMKLNQSGTALMFSTRIGGSGFDAANAVALDGADAPHIVGTTYSTDFPVGTWVFQDRLKGVSDAFLAHFRADGTIVSYATTLFGGNGGEWGAGIGVANDRYTIFGETSSSDLPLREPVQPTFGGTADAFAAQLYLSPDLLFSTYLGGTRADTLRAGTVDGAGIMTFAGFTYSTNYPTVNAFQATNRSSPIDYPEGFVSRVSLLPRGAPAVRDAAVHVATNATLFGNWEKVADASAAGGARLHNPDRGAPKLAEAYANPADYFEVTVNGLYGGPYRVWVRGKADGNAYTNDSAFLQFSNAYNVQDEADGERRIYEIGTTEAMAVALEDCAGCGLRGWAWQDGAYGRRALAPPIYFNSGAPTTVRVQRREDGVSIDQIVFARYDRFDGIASAYFSAAPGYQKDDDTIMRAQEPDLPGLAADVVIYAAVDGPELHGGWTSIADTSAAGGVRLWHPDAGAGKLASPLAAPTHYFDVHFQAKAGVGYRLWIRGRAENDYWGNDSVFVQFSDSVDSAGAEQWRLNTTSATTMNLEDCSGCGLLGWGWQDNGWGLNVRGPLVYFETSGDHTIRIQTREDGLSIDQILLSPVNFRETSPGSTKNDSVIMSR